MLARRSLPVALSITALFTGLLVTASGPAAGAAPASLSGHPATTAAHPRPAKDTTPPGPVTDLRVSANGLKTLTLSWTDPTDRDFANVLIRRAVGDQPPLSPSDGTLVATLGKRKTSFVDHGLAPGTDYSYTLFALDRHQNQSTAASVTASTLTTNAKTGLRGKLTDQQGRPIVGLAVDVRDAASGNTAASVLTDSTGQFTATNLQPGNYLVCYQPVYGTVGHSTTGYLSGCYRQQPYGYGTSGIPVTVTAGKITAGVNDYLKVAGAIAGRITDTAGNGLQNVSVIANNYDSPYLDGSSSETAADGSYRIINLPASTNYQVCFYSDGAVGGSSTGYLDQCYDGKQPFGGFGDPVTVVTGQATTVNARLATAGAITGRVLDDQGQPAAGTYVDIFGGGGTSTDDQGYYTVRGLATGSHQLCFDGSSTVTATAPYGYVQGCATNVYTVDVTAGRTATQNGTVPVAGAVGGTVTDSGGGPVEGVVVSVGTPELGEFLLTSTDFDGHYQLNGIPAGQYTVCFDPSYTSGSYVRSCYQEQAGGDPTPVTVNRAQLTTVNQQLTQGASITGTVTDANGAPISGVQVSAVGVSNYQYYSAITDDNGQYTIGSLTAQDYQVCFDTSHAQGPSVGGYTAECYDNQPTVDTATPVSVPSTGSVVVNAQLAAGSAITGLVTGSDNSRLSQVMVQATSVSTGQTTNALTDIDGSYRLVGLTAGSYTVCFDAINVHDPSPTGYLNECYNNKPGPFGGDPVQVSAGAVSAGVDAQLAVGGEITGTVTDPSGNPLQNVVVYAQTTDGSYYIQPSGTGVDGRYQLTSLPTTALAVCFQDGSGNGYSNQCYNNQPDQSTANLVTPVAGQITSGIDARMHP